jgi:rubrerythrin
MIWVCIVCGYEEESDTVPEICPVCGVDSSQFEEKKD